MESDEIRKQLSRLHDSAFGWAMVCCGRDRELAAEVLQKAYCRILSGEASFGGKSEFSTWVFGVIRHVVYEEIRNQRRHRQIFRANAIDFDQAVSSHATIEQRELAEHLQSALQKLSERQREVLHLTFYEDMTIEQAADILGISVGAARQHYQRGKASLHRILESRRELEQ